VEHKKLKQDHHDTKRELDRLKQLCSKNQIDTSTRKQVEERKAAQRASLTELSTDLPRLHRNRPLPTTRHPALILSPIHALSHDFATATCSGSPDARVVSRQRLSICCSERQDILFHENSCKPITPGHFFIFFKKNWRELIFFEKKTKTNFFFSLFSLSFSFSLSLFLCTNSLGSF
jgi:hypothetical protein